MPLDGRKLEVKPDPTEEEIQQVMEDFGWDHNRATQYLLIQNLDPRGIDAPDPEDEVGR
jgi:hypothetical protein